MKTPELPSTRQAIQICDNLNLSFSKTRYEMRLKEEEMAKKGYCLFDREKLQKAANEFLLPFGYWVQITHAETDGLAGSLKTLSAIERFFLAGNLPYLDFLISGRIPEPKERKLVMRSLDGACFIPPEILLLLEKASCDFERKEIFCIFDNSTDPFHISFLFAKSQQIINGQEIRMDFFIGGWCEKGDKVCVMPTKI